LSSRLTILPPHFPSVSSVRLARDLWKLVPYIWHYDVKYVSMFILSTFVVLLVSISALVALRLARPGVSYTWLAAAAGGVLAWISVILWQAKLPQQFSLGVWSPQMLAGASPQFSLNSYSWLFAFGLSALAAAVILTSPARAGESGVPSWLGTLAFTALGLLAVLVDNLTSLVLVWMALDLAEFTISMRPQLSPKLSEAAVAAFSVRLVGTGLAIWASVVGALSGQTFLLESVPPAAGFYLLLAAGLRLGVLPLYVASQGERSLGRGFGTVLRISTLAASLVVLTRLPASAVDPRWRLLLLTITALAALYGAWKWLSAVDELSGRPFWLIGMGAFAFAATLAGNAGGAAAWAAALLLFGGISFLYSARQVWFTRLFAVLGLLLLGLPFTLTASGWQTGFPLPFVFWPVFVASQAMLAAGYIRHLFGVGDAQLGDLPRWAQAAYPIGMAVLVASLVLAGLWGWPGAMNVGVWGAGLAVLLLAAAIVTALLRLPLFAPSANGSQVAPGLRWIVLLRLFPRLLGWLIRLAGQFLIYASGLFEGDGGLLWTLLLLVLLASFLRGR